MKISSERDVPESPPELRTLIIGPRRRLARADPGNRAALFEALGRFRVLCAEREGPRGAVEINRFVGRYFRDALDHPLDRGSRSEWYPGRLR